MNGMASEAQVHTLRFEAVMDDSLSSLRTPLPTALATTTMGFGSDEHSERIYSALLQAAAADLSPTPTQPPHSSIPTPPPLIGISLLHPIPERLWQDNDLEVVVANQTTGFLSERIEGLTPPVPSLVGVVLILLGLFFLSCGARSLNWGNHWGKKRGVQEGRAWFPGGVAGLLVGVATAGGSSFFMR